MGATLISKKTPSGGLGKTLARYVKATRDASVDAGFIRGKSSDRSIEKAYKNEFGYGWTTDLHKPMPVRNFMAQAVPIAKENIAAISKKVDAKNMKPVLQACGTQMANAIEQSIMGQNFAPNTKFTAERKMSDLILVDTGEMVENIAYKVNK